MDAEGFRAQQVRPLEPLDPLAELYGAAITWSRAWRLEAFYVWREVVETALIQQMMHEQQAGGIVEQQPVGLDDELDPLERLSFEV